MRDFQPTTVEETARFVGESDLVLSLPLSWRIRNPSLPWIIEEGGDQSQTDASTPVPVLSPSISDQFEVFEEDFVAKVPATWTLTRLRSALDPYGLTIPHSSIESREQPWDERTIYACHDMFGRGDIGELVAYNPPHWLESQHGNWRDWLLGFTAVTASGEIINSGSRVTKNVAGFDLHKFVVGSRNAFFVPLTFTLKLVSRAAVRHPQLSFGRELSDAEFYAGDVVAQRVHPTDFQTALRASEFDHCDEATCTIVREMGADEPVVRFPGDWVERIGPGATWPEFTEADAWVLRRAKALFDPTNKLNPGILGVV